MDEGKPATRTLAMVLPVYQDAAAAGRLAQELVGQLAEPDTRLHILFVDDGSPVPLEQELRPQLPALQCTIDVLRLRRNLGHQRAIAVGIAYVHDHIPCEGVLVMDADGEDRPEDAKRLVQHLRETNGGSIVFAGRTRRSESLTFQLLYRLYQVMHWVMTGIRVRVGNFSVVPAGYLPALAALPALWNHYAAAIAHARLPISILSTERGARYSGRSKMHLLSLVMHGLQAISVFSDIVAVRLLISGFILSCIGGTSVAAILIRRFWPDAGDRDWAVIQWAALFALLLLMFILSCFSLVLTMLSQRNSLNFLPVRDYKFFTSGTHRILPPS